MHKFIVPHIDTHMAVARASAEKHQVADLQFVAGDRFAFLHECRGGARDFHVQLREEGEVDEAGAVNAFGAKATVAVRNALPVFFLGEQAIEDEGLPGREILWGINDLRGRGLAFRRDKGTGRQAGEQQDGGKRKGETEMAVHGAKAMADLGGEAAKEQEGSKRLTIEAGAPHAALRQGFVVRPGRALLAFAG